jgi:hypothetical protein
MFVIQASLQRIYEIPFSIHRLCEFFSDPQSFARNMPIIDHIAPLDGGYDVSRWRFVVRAPIVAPIVWEFLVRRRINEETGEIFYASSDADRDTFRCDVHVRPGANGATDADVRLTVRLVRDHAKEIHPLAGWVGERWINRIVLDCKTDCMKFRGWTRKRRAWSRRPQSGRLRRPTCRRSRRRRRPNARRRRSLRRLSPKRRRSRSAISPDKKRSRIPKEKCSFACGEPINNFRRNGCDEVDAKAQHGRHSVPASVYRRNDKNVSSFFDNFIEKAAHSLKMFHRKPSGPLKNPGDEPTPPTTADAPVTIT